MRNFAKGTWIAGILLAISCQTLCAQQLTLRDAIRIAQVNSLDAKVARFSFLANYWTYRSFKGPTVAVGKPERRTGKLQPLAGADTKL